MQQRSDHDGFSPPLAAWALLFLLLLPACWEPSKPRLLVFAAASLEDVMHRLGEDFTAESGVPVAFNFAGSNTLAQQLRASTGGDVFVSASRHWMDQVETVTRRTFLSNRLVVVTSRPEGSVENLCDAPFERLVLGDPEAVPAGVYARQWMETVSCGEQTLWDRWKERIVPAPDVRAALGLVKADPDLFGIVYLTDVTDDVRVLVVVEDGPAIEYVVGVPKGSPHPELAREFVEYLGSPEARAILEREGFIPLP